MRKKLFCKSCILGVVLLFFGASVVSALNINVEPKIEIYDFNNPDPDLATFYPTDDAKIAQDDPNKNYDGEAGINIRNEFGGGGGSGWCSDGLYRFDISSIPSGASIIRATFHLFYNKWTSTNPAGRMLNVYRITSDWNEDTVTWNTAPTYNPAASAFSPVPATVNLWMEWDVTSDIEEFVSGTTNYGWRLRDDNYWGGPDIPLSQFRTREAGQELSPYLEIEYTKSRSRHTSDEKTNENSGREPLIYLFYGWCENVTTKGLVFNEPIVAYPGKYDFYLYGILFEANPKNTVETSNFIGYIREIHTQGIVFYRVRGIAFGNIEWS
jgi:hypothetical protein